MFILKTLMNDNNIAIEHNGYKAILIFKSISEAIQYIRSHNILCDEVYEVENIEKFRKHLEEHNLYIAIYNFKTKSFEIYKKC